jgi:hypothetical protein
VIRENNQHFISNLCGLSVPDPSDVRDRKIDNIKYGQIFW